MMIASSAASGLTWIWLGQK